MTRAGILEAVREVVREACDCEAPVEEASDLQGDLQLDSLQRMTLAMELENRFALCFEPEDEEGLATVGDVVELVARALEARESGAGADRA
jgi:acyl carrier protein